MITSYAQNFEDVMLWRALSHIEQGFYIDIGAQDPVVDSVSLAFYEKGWRGVHVEPTTRYADALRAHRPDESVLQAVIADQPGVIKFYEIEGTGISTADAEIAAGHRVRGFELHEIQVPAVTLSEVFASYSVRDVHWMKIDVEGFESSVLRGWGDSPVRPWIVVVESTLPLTQTSNHEKWEFLLHEKNYEAVYFDGLNRFYVSHAHPELRQAFDAPPNLFDGFRLSGTASSPFHAILADRLHAAEEKTQVMLQAREAELRKQAEVDVAALTDRINAARARESDALASLTSVAVQLRRAEFPSGGGDGEWQRDDRLIAELERLAQSYDQAACGVRAESAARHLEALREECTRLIQQAADRRHQLAASLSEAEAEQARLTRQTHEQALQLSLQASQAELRLIEQETRANARLADQAVEADRRLAEQVERSSRQLAQAKADAALQMAEQSLRAERQAAQHLRELTSASRELGEARAALGQAQRRHRREMHQLQLRMQLLRRRSRVSKHAARAREHRLLLDLELARREFEQQARGWDESRQRMGQELSALRESIDAERKEFNQHNASALGHIADVEARYRNAVIEADQLAKAIHEIRASFSWRLMAPFRALFERRFAASIGNLPAGVDIDATSAAVQAPEAVVPSNTAGGNAAETTQHSELTEHTMSDSLKRALAESEAAPRAGTYRLRDFMTVDDAKFVVLAYRVLLRRDPDPDGFAHFMERARQGDSRLRILAAIAQSKEGRINNVEVAGLKSSVAKLKLAKLPIIGPLYAKVWGYDEQREISMHRFASIESRLESISLAQHALLSSHERKTSDIQLAIASLSARFDALSEHVSGNGSVGATAGGGASSAAVADLQVESVPKSVFDSVVVLAQPEARDVIRGLTALVHGSREAQMLAAQ
ncbi:FkbM family methyltransferase [Burkholderia glumae]|uniref:FkbM family methyltransferase n=1 Tax=Burkholderia glumae TaxID=337 RepID=UPI000F603994|nr:FkbM family methyltransferase [Burkholderia glumae]MCQ0031955.1 FkbM family methyltransferase [Burkholderia glumae]MCQ0037047.1 FkbM family methyltransferase [Burkholderia glumae]QJW78493.1 FkbM family methyltransferase [Burkholderia glumae]RQZ74845.1 FkbM family methyltransferase [Burkholderia glumae]UVS83437.1 FkbM family methyltransferase [Burkholderia glumae]